MGIKVFLLRLVTLGITGFIIYNIFNPSEFWTQHPSFMMAGYLIFMLNAILSQKEGNNMLHVLLQTFAIASILYGGNAMFVHKEAQHRPHFKSWHAIGGGILIGTHLLVYFFTLAGKLFNMPHNPVHGKFGKVLFTMACGAMFSGYFILNQLTEKTMYFSAYLVFVVACVFLIGKVRHLPSIPSSNCNSELKKR